MGRGGSIASYPGRSPDKFQLPDSFYLIPFIKRESFDEFPFESLAALHYLTIIPTCCYDLFSGGLCHYCILFDCSKGCVEFLRVVCSHTIVSGIITVARAR